MLTRILSLAICICGLLSPVLGDEVDDLVAQMKSEDREVRYVSARRLGRLRERAAPAIPHLIDRLEDQGASLPTKFGSDPGFFGPRVQDAAGEALARIGHASVGPLRQALKHPNNKVREHAAAALEQLGPVARSAFPELRTAIQDSDRMVRWQAIRAIAKIGEDPAMVVPLLTQIANHEDEESSLERKAALSMFGLTDPGGDLVIPILLQAVRRNDADDAYAALKSVQSLGPRAGRLVPQLTELLRSESLHWDAYYDLGFQVPLRSSVARTLGIIGPPAETALPQLVRMMGTDEVMSVRWAAGAAIVRIAPGHVDAVRARKFVLESEHSDAILELDPRSAAEYFLRVLQEPDRSEGSSRHWSAIRNLGTLGRHSAPAVPRLVEILDSESSILLRSSAVGTLGRIGPAAAAAIPALHREHARSASDIGDVDDIKETLWRIQPREFSIPSVD